MLFEKGKTSGIILSIAASNNRRLFPNFLEKVKMIDIYRERNSNQCRKERRDQLMEFGWINVLGAAIVIIMLIPNIIYAIKNKNFINNSTNKVMKSVEQIGRYGCIVLMWLPLFVWKFEFSSVYIFLIYLLGNGFLLLLYVLFWILYFKRKNKNGAMALAIIPSCIFLLSGLLLHHWTLAAFAVLFGLGHIYVTVMNNQ